jgi:hypothetical protein
VLHSVDGADDVMDDETVRRDPRNTRRNAKRRVEPDAGVLATHHADPFELTAELRKVGELTREQELQHVAFE